MAEKVASEGAGKSPIIKTTRLTRMYGKTVGIQNLNLEVRAGEIFGFLGPNGAGKTTTINLLLDLIKPTSGNARVFGMDTHRKGQQVRKRIGFIAGDTGYYEDMRGIEYLRFFSGIRGLNCDKRIRKMARYFSDLALERRIKTYSKGMKQILGIMQAFMAEPELYVLDEPTANLDPLMCARFYELLEKEHEKGKTIFLSSHQLGEVEHLCQKVCIIKNGESVALENVEDIKQKMKQTIELTFYEPVDIERLKMEGVEKVLLSDGRYKLIVSGKINRIFAMLADLPVKSFDYHKMTIEDLFFEHFKR